MRLSSVGGDLLQELFGGICFRGRLTVGYANMLSTEFQGHQTLLRRGWLCGRFFGSSEIVDKFVQRIGDGDQVAVHARCQLVDRQGLIRDGANSEGDLSELVIGVPEDEHDPDEVRDQGEDENCDENEGSDRGCRHVDQTNRRSAVT